MTRYAINIVGFIDTHYDKDQVYQMLNRLSMKDQCKPINVVEIVVEEMNHTTNCSINVEDVSKKRLSMY